MNMNGNEIWVWLAIGTAPYHIIWQSVKNGRMVKVQALLWSLEVNLWQNGSYQWTLHIPFLKRVRAAIWAALIHLKGDGPLQK
jgi:hypothetical protein